MHGNEGKNYESRRAGDGISAPGPVRTNKDSRKAVTVTTAISSHWQNSLYPIGHIPSESRYESTLFILFLSVTL
jgi:hypothetical protein